MTEIDALESTIEDISSLAKEDFLGINNHVGKNDQTSLTSLLRGNMAKRTERQERFLDILEVGVDQQFDESLISLGDIPYLRTFALFDYWYGATKKVFREEGKHVKLFIDQNETYDLADLYMTLVELHDPAFREDFFGTLNELTDFFTKETDNYELIRKLQQKLDGRFHNATHKHKDQRRQYNDELTMHQFIGRVDRYLQRKLDEKKDYELRQEFIKNTPLQTPVQKPEPYNMSCLTFVTVVGATLGTVGYIALEATKPIWSQYVHLP